MNDQDHSVATTNSVELHELLKQFGGPARMLLDKGFTQKQVAIVMAVIKTERYFDRQRLIQRLEKELEHYRDNGDERYGIAKQWNTMLEKLEDDLVQIIREEGLVSSH